MSSSRGLPLTHHAPERRLMPAVARDCAALANHRAVLGWVGHRRSRKGSRHRGSLALKQQQRSPFNLTSKWSIETQFALMRARRGNRLFEPVAGRASGRLSPTAQRDSVLRTINKFYEPCKPAERVQPLCLGMPGSAEFGRRDLQSGHWRELTPRAESSGINVCKH